MMNSTLSQIKDLLEKLSFHDLIKLLEHISQEIQRSAERQKHLEEDMIAMAFDAEIQREFDLIEQDFLHTIVDGLEG